MIDLTSQGQQFASGNRIYERLSGIKQQLDMSKMLTVNLLLETELAETDCLLS
jgi:hypothetical protein